MNIDALYSLILNYNKESSDIVTTKVLKIRKFHKYFYKFYITSELLLILKLFVRNKNITLFT